MEKKVVYEMDDEDMKKVISYCAVHMMITILKKEHLDPDALLVGVKEMLDKKG